MSIRGNCIILSFLLPIYLFAISGPRPVSRLAFLPLLWSFSFGAARVFGSGGRVDRDSGIGAATMPLPRLQSRAKPRYFSRFFASRNPEIVVIVGSGRTAGTVWRRMRVNYHSRINFLGLVDERPPQSMPLDMATRYLGEIDDLRNLLVGNKVDRLVVALSDGDDARARELADRAAAIAQSAGVLVNDTQEFLKAYA
jgi:hypothetical protein